MTQRITKTQTQALMDTNIYWIAVGTVLLLIRTEAEDIKATSGSDVTFQLPDFRTCPNLRLSDPKDVLLLTVRNGNPLISGHMINRAGLGLSVGSVTFTLKNVQCRDEGAYFLEALSGERIPNCERVFSLQLDGQDRSYWLSWGPWSSCNDNTSCTRGLRARTRECTIPGLCCHGDGHECEHQATKCLYFTWEAWSVWSGCSVTCGAGYKRRRRECWDSYAEGSTLDQCIGEPDGMDQCTMTPCPDPVAKETHAWNAWSDWSGCSVTCGTGRKHRRRRCLNYPTGGSAPGQCVGSEEEVEGCHSESCQTPRVKSTRITFSWTAWGQWTPCSKSCDTGWQTRDRKCYDQYDREVSGYCTGDSTQNVTCNTDSCKDLKISSPPSDETTVSMPLWSIVGGAAGILILVLLVVIISLVIILRRKSRKKTTDRIDATNSHNSKKKTTKHVKQNLKLPPKSGSDMRMSRVSDFHVYAEINDDDVYVKTEKSMSVVTIDNPYAPYPKSASPMEQEQFPFSSTSGHQETSFTYVNTSEELPVNAGNKQRLDSAGYLEPLRDQGRGKGKKGISYKR